MYEDLVKHLRNRANGSYEEKCEGCEYTEDFPPCVHCTIKAFNDAADAIEDLIAALTASNEVIAKNKPRWIPVTERLPEGDNRILVCSKLRDGQYWQSVCRFANNLHEVDEYDFPNERRPGFYYYDDEYGWIEKTGVTHWMPLPQPPKEDSK